MRRLLTHNHFLPFQVVIFEAALNWATAECRRQKLEPTAENQRSILGDILFCVRIPAMTLEEFANGPAQVAILSVKGRALLIAFLPSSSASNDPFSDL